MSIRSPGDQGTRATQPRPVDIGAAAAAKVTQDHRAVRHLERRVAAGDVRVIQHHLPGQRLTTDSHAVVELHTG